MVVKDGDASHGRIPKQSPKTKTHPMKEGMTSIISICQQVFVMPTTTEKLDETSLKSHSYKPGG